MQVVLLTCVLLGTADLARAVAALLLLLSALLDLLFQPVLRVKAVSDTHNETRN